MLVGGGTSIMPRTAPVLYDFVDADNGEYLEAAEAVFRIFDRQDWLRVNRARARIKVFVDKFGIDELRRQVDEERKGDWVKERDFDVAKLRFDDDEEAVVTKLPMATDFAQPNGDRSDVPAVGRGQRQEAAPGRLQHRPGERHPRRPDARSSSAASPRSCATSAAATPARRSARTSSCAGCATRRPTPSGSGSARSGWPIRAPTRSSTRSRCPGTDSCKLGITSSMGLNRAIHDRVEQMDITDPLTKKIHIKMSGCPNGCGQHHIGNIGFYGASIKVGDKTIPAYVAHIGGRYEGGEGVAFGQRLKIRLPAKRVPGRGRAVDPLLRGRARATARRSTQFAERVGLAEFEDEGEGPVDPRRVQPREHRALHRLEPARAVPGDPRGGRMRGLAPAPTADPRPRGAHPRGGARATPSTSSRRGSTWRARSRRRPRSSWTCS